MTHYPVRGRTPLMELEWEMKRLNRMDGIRLLFELFVAMLRLCTGDTLRENKALPLSPMLREEVRKLEQYDKDLQLLCRYHIDTAKELSAFREKIIGKIHTLTQERKGIYNKIRRAIRSGQLPCRIVGRTYLISWDNLVRWLNCVDGGDSYEAIHKT